MRRLAHAAKVLDESGISSFDTSEMFFGLKADLGNGSVGESWRELNDDSECAFGASNPRWDSMLAANFSEHVMLHDLEGSRIKIIGSAWPTASEKTAKSCLSELCTT
eukprot:5461997-Amphidinium_carterae.1